MLHKELNIHIFDYTGEYIVSFHDLTTTSEYLNISKCVVSNALRTGDSFSQKYFVSKDLEFNLKSHNKKLFNK